MAIFNLTRKADYGLLMLAELAKQGQGNLISVKKMSEDQGLPRAFLAQIGQDLMRAGIVGSKEGRNGGYYLMKNPSEVDVKTALEAIEGKIAMVACDGEAQACPLGKACSQRDFMCSLSKNVKNLLSSYSLTDLISH